MPWQQGDRVERNRISTSRPGTPHIAPRDTVGQLAKYSIVWGTEYIGKSIPRTSGEEIVRNVCIFWSAYLHSLTR